MTPEQFYDKLAEFDINLSDEQKWQLHRYYELLVEQNEKMNLTGRNFLKLLDYTPAEMEYLLDLAAELKEKKKIEKTRNKKK